MTNPSVNSIVERLEPCPFCGCEPMVQGDLETGTRIRIFCPGDECMGPRTTAFTLQDACVQWNARAPSQAATTIAELQADLEKLKDPNAVHLNMLRGGIAKPSWDQILHLYPEESSRIRSETVEACAKVAEQTGNFRDYRRDELTVEFGQPRFDMMNEIIASIRALGSTDGDTAKEKA